MKKIILGAALVLVLTVLGVNSISAQTHEHKYDTKAFVNTCPASTILTHTCECGHSYKETAAPQHLMILDKENQVYDCIGCDQTVPVK